MEHNTDRLSKFNELYESILNDNTDVIEEGKLKNFIGSALAGLSLASGIGATAAPIQKTNSAIVLPHVPDSWKTPPATVKPANKKVEKTSKTTINKDVKKDESSKNVLELARLIYAEAGPNTTDKDMKLICQVIMNRVGSRDFRNLTTKKVSSNAWEVIADKKSFNAYYDDRNSSWSDFEKVRQKMLKNEKLSTLEQKVANKIKLATTFATAMMKNDTTFLNDLSADEKTSIYYHDNSISKPKGWTNTTSINASGTSGKLKFYIWQK